MRRSRSRTAPFYHSRFALDGFRVRDVVSVGAFVRCFFALLESFVWKLAHKCSTRQPVRRSLLTLSSEPLQSACLSLHLLCSLLQTALFNSIRRRALFRFCVRICLLSLVFRSSVIEPGQLTQQLLLRPPATRIELNRIADYTRCRCYYSLMTNLLLPPDD